MPGGVDGGRRDPDPPPGLNHAKINFDVAGGPIVSESLRHLELPSLPQVGSEGAVWGLVDYGHSTHVGLGSGLTELVGTVADGGGRLLWEVA